MSAVRFAFDTEFDKTGAILREGGAAVSRFTAADLEAAKKEAYALGQRDALAQAEKRAAAALETIAKSARATIETTAQEARTLQAEAAALALTLARAASGRALDAYGRETVEAAFAEAAHMLREAPRILIRLPAADAEALTPRLHAIAEDHGLTGALLVRGDAALKAGDVRIDWGDAAIVRDRDEVLARAERIILDALPLEIAP